MNNVIPENKSAILIALIVAGVITGQAQTASTSASGGLLGQRYIEVGAGLTDPHGSANTGLTAGTKVNLPVQGNLDVGFGYAYGRLNTEFGGVFEARTRDHTLFSTATGYTRVGGIKPFLAAGLGYAWTKNDLLYAGTGTVSERTDQAVWALSVGAEIPLAAVTLTPRVSYQDGFRDSNGAFTYGAEAHTWFTKSVGVFADVAYANPRSQSITAATGGVGNVAIFSPNGGGAESWTYKVGARYRF